MLSYLILYNLCKWVSRICIDFMGEVDTGNNFGMIAEDNIGSLVVDIKLVYKEITLLL